MEDLLCLAKHFRGASSLPLAVRCLQSHVPVGWVNPGEVLRRACLGEATARQGIPSAFRIHSTSAFSNLSPDHLLLAPIHLGHPLLMLLAIQRYCAIAATYPVDVGKTEAELVKIVRRT